MQKKHLFSVSRVEEAQAELNYKETKAGEVPTWEESWAKWEPTHGRDGGALAKKERSDSEDQYKRSVGNVVVAFAHR